MPTPHVLIIGAGRIGQAIADVIRDGTSGADIFLWDKNDHVVANQQPLDSLVESANVIFCCTPSWAVREVLTSIRPTLKSTATVVTLAKGCEATTGKTMVEVADEVLPAKQPHAVLGGPMLAETLERGHRGIGVVGSHQSEPYVALVPLFENTPLTIVADGDPNGVALAGVLKNIYAFLVGIGVGLGWSIDQQRSFFDRAREEYVEVGLALGVSPNTIQGPAGVEDFMETATSPMSHNHHVGEEFGKRGTLASECEATISFPIIHQRLGSHRFPLLGALQSILLNHQSPSILTTLI